MFKGAPHGSVIELFAYIVHCVDLMVILEGLCEILFNYADNNAVRDTVPEIKEHAETLINNLKMLDWFKSVK